MGGRPTCPRAANLLRIVDLRAHEITQSIVLGPLPDTLRLSADQKLLTVGLRGTPAQIAIVDTTTFDVELVTIGGTGTVAGHQWTSASGGFTFVAFEVHKAPAWRSSTMLPPTPSCSGSTTPVGRTA